MWRRLQARSCVFGREWWCFFLESCEFSADWQKLVENPPILHLHPFTRPDSLCLFPLFCTPACLTQSSDSIFILTYPPISLLRHTHTLTSAHTHTGTCSPKLKKLIAQREMRWNENSLDNVLSLTKGCEDVYKRRYFIYLNTESAFSALNWMYSIHVLSELRGTRSHMRELRLNAEHQTVLTSSERLSDSSDHSEVNSLIGTIVLVFKSQILGAFWNFLLTKYSHNWQTWFSFKKHFNFSLWNKFFQAEVIII